MTPALGCWGVALVAILLSTALFIARRDYLVWRDDEAVFFLTARAVAQGHALYREVWYNYPPSFILYLSAVLRLAGGTLPVARGAVFAWGMIALGMVAWLGWFLRGRGGALGALFLLAMAPLFVMLSSAVMAEIPAFALASAGVCAALLYCERGKVRWLALSGALCALSICVKPTTFPALLVPALAAVWVPEDWPNRWRAWGILGVGFVLPAALVVLPQHPREFLAQFLGTYARGREAFSLDLWGNLRQIGKYLYHDEYGLSHLSLLALATYGAMRARPLRRGPFLLVALWFGGTLLQLVFHTPLYRHHLVALLFPLAAMAGAGLGYLLEGLTSQRGWGRLPLALLLAWAVFEAREAAWVSAVTLPALEADRPEMMQEAIRWVEENTSPTARIVTDAHIIAIRANREVPLETINVSRMRIRTGGIGNAWLIETVRREAPEAIVFWEKKLSSLDDFAAWVGCHYELARAFDERHRIYRARPPVSLPPEATIRQADFGAMGLLGYMLSATEVRPNTSLTVTLYWEAKAPVEGDWTVFVHLLDGQGERIAQHDGKPAFGTCPTWVWQPGERFEDVHPIAVEGLGAGGPYEIVMGWYDATSGKRLREGAFPLATLE